MIRLRKVKIEALKGNKKALKELQAEQNRTLKLIKCKELYKKST